MMKTGILAVMGKILVVIMTPVLFFLYIAIYLWVMEIGREIHPLTGTRAALIVSSLYVLLQCQIGWILLLIHYGVKIGL